MRFDPGGSRCPPSAAQSAAPGGVLRRSSTPSSATTCVVAVLLSVLALSHGTIAAPWPPRASAGARDRAAIAQAANENAAGSLPHDSIPTILECARQLPRVPTTRPLPRLKPIASSICAFLDNGKLSALTLTGRLAPMSCGQRPEMHLVQVECFKSGPARDAIVGKSAAER